MKTFSRSSNQSKSSTHVPWDKKPAIEGIAGDAMANRFLPNWALIQTDALYSDQQKSVPGVAAHQVRAPGSSHRHSNCSAYMGENHVYRWRGTRMARTNGPERIGVSQKTP